MTSPLLEWFGYAASVVVAVSLMMSSILKIRWYNLLGASMFSLYGFLIGALPVGLLNLFIAVVDIYYLIKIYTVKEYFKVLPVYQGSSYLNYFLQFYKTDIARYFPGFDEQDNGESMLRFYVLRNLKPASVFIGEQRNDLMIIHLDYVVPEYRDFKIAKFIYEQNRQIFKERGITTLIAESGNQKHNHYLEKMGFRRSDSTAGSYIKTV